MEFFRVGLSLKCQPKSQLHLRIHAFARFAFQSLGEETSRLHHEPAVKKVQRLQWRCAAVSPGRDLPAIGTIEDAKHTFRSLADHRGINHAPEILLPEFLFRRVNPNIIVVGLERRPARATGSKVEFASDGKNAVPEALRLEATWLEAPEQAARGISGVVERWSPGVRSSWRKRFNTPG